MKILFYVEPHSVRDSFTEHRYPFEQFRLILADIYNSGNEAYEGVEARIFSNHFVGGLNFPTFYSEWPMVLQPTKNERVAIEDTARMWKFQGMRNWIGLMQDPEGELAQLYYSMLLRIKQTEFDFDVIVCWGENAAVRAIAERFGVQTVYMELASMRAPFPNAFLMDPKGVNGSASTTEFDISVLEELLTPLPAAAIPVCLNEELAPGKQSTTIPQTRYSPVSSALRDFLSRPGPIALVPLQLADDANQLIYSDFAGVQEFADAAMEPLLEAGYRVILKGHPSAVHRGGYVMDVQRKCLRKYERNPNVHILELDSPASDYLPTLDAVDLVVTNNSSVGFEAMLMGRLTVALGRACYAPKNALPTLEMALTCKIDDELGQFWRRRARLAVTYMLACAFPLTRKVGVELVNRAQMWSGLSGHSVSEPYGLSKMLGQFAWSTWSQGDVLRKVTSRTDNSGHSLDETSGASV